MLVVRRRDNGKLACIGGFVEVGETLEQATRREVREETGLEVTSLQMIPRVRACACACACVRACEGVCVCVCVCECECAGAQLFRLGRRRCRRQVSWGQPNHLAFSRDM